MPGVGKSTLWEQQHAKEYYFGAQSKGKIQQHWFCLALCLPTSLFLSPHFFLFFLLPSPCWWIRSRYLGLCFKLSVIAFALPTSQGCYEQNNRIQEGISRWWLVWNESWDEMILWFNHLTLSRSLSLPGFLTSHSKKLNEIISKLSSITNIQKFYYSI